MKKTLLVAALALSACAAGAAEFTFDAAEFERKPFELGGYVEYRHDYFRLNRDGAFYGLSFYDRGDPSSLARNAGTLKLEGKYTRGDVSLRARTHLEYADDQFDGERTNRFDELALAYKANPGLTFEAGKIAPKWGKGYAWNPVGFIERVKDPNDPELAREGFWMGTADWVRSFEGPLKTVALTPVLVPSGGDLNGDFGRTGHVNVAAKLYLLWYDTDIDFMYLAGGSRTSRFGFDFSRNLTTALEVHGEWARVRNAERRSVTPAGVPRLTREHADSYLLGVRYLTADDTTFIAEYYRNGNGYGESEMQDFFSFVDTRVAQSRATGDPAFVRTADNAARAGYGRAQAMQRYLYVRVSQKDPFDLLYFTPAITSIVNLQDGSFSVAPELAYSGFTNVELRLRFFALGGGGGTDFGEKQSKRRVELRARFYF